MSQKTGRAGWVLDDDGFGVPIRLGRDDRQGDLATAQLTRAGIVTTAVLIALAAKPAAPVSAASGCEVQGGATESALAAKVVELVNTHRRSVGLRVLHVGPALERSAAWKARHMARNGYMSHLDMPGRRTLAQRLRSCGFTGRSWGEVLAAGQRRPRVVVRAWLSSPSHRAVLEGRWWRSVGAGAARSRAGGLYWALDFGA